MWAFLAGLVVGALLVVVIIVIILLDPWAPSGPVDPPFIDQFRPIQIPEELRQFLKSGNDGQGLSHWESCHSLSMLLHMFYQEHKDTRLLRRWFQKRLQMELNDIATRSAAGRLLQEIRIRDLALGTKFPIVNAIRIEKVEMSEDKNSFENITFIIDMDYTGGFETSIDVTTMFGKNANLSIKVTKLAGLVRLILSRKPYNHWTFSFVSTPIFETDISSAIQGRQLKRLIPIIKESIKRALQRKHVWPNYKVRYRPLFANPLLQATPPQSSFAHVKLEGGLEVTVLQCSRLNLDQVHKDSSYEVYCTVTLDQRPFIQSSSTTHSVSVMLVFSRHDINAQTGLTFEKYPSPSALSMGVRPVRVSTVEDDSLAEKALFKPGDTLVAINNVPIRSERQAVRFLQQTLGDLTVLVERCLDDNDDHRAKEVMNDTDFADLDMMHRKDSKQRSNTPSSESRRRHSTSLIASVSTSILDMNTESLTSSLYSLAIDFLLENCISGDNPYNDRTGCSLVQRTESARVPHVLISQPSMDLRRTRSESQLDVWSSDAAEHNLLNEEQNICIVSAVAGSEMPVDVDTSSVVFRKDETLTENRAATRIDSAKSLLTMGGSSASLVSSTSKGTNEEEDDVSAGTGMERQQSTRRRDRIQATFQAGKRKVLDLMPAKRKSSDWQNENGVEMGTEAGESDQVEAKDGGSATVSLNSKKNLTETLVVDKKDKKKSKRGSRTPTPITREDGKQLTPSDSPASSCGGPIRSRTTKCAPLRESPVWGQSLHFELDNASSSLESKTPSLRSSQYKYLNVTLHAKECATGVDVEGPSSVESSVTPEPKRPILLGYTSLYIPQLIDDCCLTLSCRHREVFNLKSPNTETPITNTTEFARHAGHDARLMYGDITLGFRYFPNGLPQGAGSCVDDSDTETVGEEDRATSRPLSPPSMTPSAHDWTDWSAKHAGGGTCSMCRGKIWLKHGNCCRRCFVVVHAKCVQRANTGITCTPHSSQDIDAAFENLDVDLNVLDANVNEDECVVQPMMQSSTAPSSSIVSGKPQEIVFPDGTSVSRRTRLKNKMSSYFRRSKPPRANDEGDTDSSATSRQSELLSNIDREKNKTDTDSQGPSSPVASIKECLSDLLPSLEGSPFIDNLCFEPGNAYNEHTIAHAKRLGREIFAELGKEDRISKINAQIDTIQLAIRETKDGRLAAMHDGSDESGTRFQGLDERLQALAVLMLHYCSALQDCASQGRASPSESMKDIPDEQEDEANNLIESANATPLTSVDFGINGTDSSSLCSDESTLLQDPPKS